MKKIICWLLVLGNVSLSQNCNLFAYIPHNDNLERLLETGQFNEAEYIAKNLDQETQKHYWLSKLYFYLGDYLSARNEIKTALSTNYDKDWENMMLYYQALEKIQKDSIEFTSEHFRLKAKNYDRIL